MTKCFFSLNVNKKKSATTTGSNSTDLFSVCESLQCFTSTDAISEQIHTKQSSFELFFLLCFVPKFLCRRGNECFYVPFSLFVKTITNYSCSILWFHLCVTIKTDCEIDNMK